MAYPHTNFQSDSATSIDNTQKNDFKIHNLYFLSVLSNVIQNWVTLRCLYYKLTYQVLFKFDIVVRRYTRKFVYFLNDISDMTHKWVTLNCTFGALLCQISFVCVNKTDENRVKDAIIYFFSISYMVFPM